MSLDGQQQPGDGALACVVVRADRAKDGPQRPVYVGAQRLSPRRRRCGAVLRRVHAAGPAVEGYGFCGRGEAGPFTENGALELGGRLPINTSGGGLSEAYVHGFNLINEGVRQMRGTSVDQVDDAAVCLVTSGECVPTSALLLRR